MALFLVTVKRKHYANGIQLEEGMSVEVSTKFSSPNVNGGIAIQEAFMRKYGLDIKKNNGISSTYLEIEKIS